jgi:ATP-dependent RNA helicase RhlE
MPFDKLGLIEPLLRSVRDEGYTLSTEIQKQAIPYVLQGRDLLGCAQTGTGKTAAFALPILQRLHGRHAGGTGHGHKRTIRCLVLTPTRELAAQIGDSFRAYGRHAGLRHTVIFGGVKQRPQEQALKQGVDILVATPGRLLDLLGQKVLTLGHLEIFVLDEADRMLDMGFIHDIRRVIAQLPEKRQTLMFSATMPREIQALADSLLRHPAQVRVAPESPAATTVQQSLYHVETSQKTALLEHLLGDAAITRMLVFTRTKRGADRVVKRLSHARIAAEAIHSNKSQNARLRALDNFKKGTTRVLVASDIASRGLDVDEISHVVNYDLPHEPETYVHRIGRTGRAGATGQAVSFCSEDERGQLKDIEKLLGRHIPVLRPSVELPKPEPRTAPLSSPQGGAAHRGRGRRGPGSTQANTGGRTAPASGRAPHKPAEHATDSPEGQRQQFWRRSRRGHGPSAGRPPAVPGQAGGSSPRGQSGAARRRRRRRR